MLSITAGRVEALVPQPLTLLGMTTGAAPKYVRLQVEMVLEIADAEALTRAAVAHIDADCLPDEQRVRAVAAVSDEVCGAAEAVVCLVHPIDLVSGAPGVELAQASWSGELVDAGAARGEWAGGGDRGAPYTASRVLSSEGPLLAVEERGRG